MEIKTKHIGYCHGISSMIELIVSSDTAVITEDITDLYGYIDEDFIYQLKNVVDELEIQNSNLKAKESCQ